MKKNEVLIHAATWMNIENIMLSERKYSQKTAFYMVPFTWKFKIGKPIDWDGISGYLGMDGAGAGE